MRKLRYVILGVVALLVLYLLLWPVPIEPVGWTPPDNPGLTGEYEANNLLAGAELYPLAGGHGPEDTAVGPDGLVYTGLADGSIVRFSPGTGGEPETIVGTGGRPLGLAFHNDRLYIADAFVGLLYIDGATAASGHRVEVAADEVDGAKMLFVDDVAVASNGTVWFTDASMRFDQHNYVTDITESWPSGRLLSWDAVSGQTTVHVEELAFANGVALGPGEAYVLVNESMRYRIRPYWLTGEKAGQTDVFIDNLPGFPDNLSYNGEDLFWVALVYPRDRTIDSLMPRPFLRKMIMRLPAALRVSEPDPLALVIALDHDGNVVHNLQDHTGHHHTVTSVNEADGYLWLGSLIQPHVAGIAVPETGP
ncbi:MAG: SMP-30/gluconolactonase/LRE family protein [Dehalococcoidia bacterium]